MNTHQCEAAGREDIALGQPARDRLHGRCPGAYRTPAGEVRQCGCACHAGTPIPDETDERPFATLEEVPRSLSTTEGAQASKKTRKRPSRACECCGLECNGRFLPGHDAKLKSRLTREAAAGDARAWAELVQRDWARLVADGKVTATVRAEGRYLAAREPDLTDARTSERTQA